MINSYRRLLCQQTCPSVDVSRFFTLFSGISPSCSCIHHNKMDNSLHSYRYLLNNLPMYITPSRVISKYVLAANLLKNTAFLTGSFKQNWTPCPLSRRPWRWKLKLSRPTLPRATLRWAAGQTPLHGPARSSPSCTGVLKSLLKDRGCTLLGNPLPLFPLPGICKPMTLGNKDVKCEKRERKRRKRERKRES
jgi:hypothetical protein